MLKTQLQAPTPPETPNTLSDLSRRASVISTSSSDDGNSEKDADPGTLTTPTRPRPIRTFSGPRTSSPMPGTPRASRPPSYLTRDLSVGGEELPRSPTNSKPRDSSRAASRTRGITMEDFETHGELGEGAYSTVMLATYLRKRHKYALKIVDKAHLKRHNKTNTVFIERAALSRVSQDFTHPGIIKMAFSFHDQWSLYFVLEWAQNGELQSLISRLGSLSLECSRYYAAQILDAVGFVHERGIIHRDLKPENLLLDENWRIKLTDFGTAVVLNSDLEPEKFAGTAQYIAPEIITKNESSKSSDLWSYGAIVYQMIAGRFAFAGLSNYLIMEKVKKVEYKFPEGFDEQAQSLVSKLLVREPEQRLGAGDDADSNMQALRSHPFFTQISWPDLWNGPVPALEAGLVKKEHPLANGTDDNWGAVDDMWDTHASEAGVRSSGEDLLWASSQNGQGLFSRPSAFSQHAGGEIGSMGGVRELVMQPRSQSGSHTPKRTPTALVNPTKSETSLPTVSVAIAQPSPNSLNPALRALHIEEEERGRKHAPTPIQGHAPPVDFGRLLSLPANEKPSFVSTVEISSLRRRASRLLRPLASAPVAKKKMRHLVLTDKRLLLVKYESRHPDDVTVKGEYLLGGASDKESAGRVISSVATKGDRDVVVLTASKTVSFTAPDSVTAGSWVKRLTERLSRT
ncbi:kinase-like protein [Cylindrobasidium torrendii FP15055 ss-10]|uniref:non-specific serine/threonine protein kinase n=1 Tax=Cylindrobasidium torrendii FP15055 ss-10 TaxID=1314674 RepID=A0A0D7AZ21_9AGAR|nr:kinase-like protein [Cylindrobasidium torrendii FP15055 ss-10]